MARSYTGKTLIPIAVLAVLISGAILLFYKTSGAERDPLRIEVFAKQYSWSFGYPAMNNRFAEDEVHVPVGLPVEFEMHSEDVVHAFWIPEWKLKADVPPGQIETASTTPEKAGAYQLVCAEFCGIAHKAMHARVIVESPGQFQEWVTGLGAIPAHLRELARVEREVESIHESAQEQTPG